MTKILFALILLTAMPAFQQCTYAKKNTAKDPEKNKAEMMRADSDFAHESETKGMKNAFLEYIDSNGVLLRPNMLPVVGADAVDYLIAINDTGYKMSWRPKGGMVAESGELGYTYGIYEIVPTVIDTVLYGSYINVWKKQQDGKWKYVLGSSNEGIGDLAE